MPDYFNYTDKDGNEFKLVFHPYEAGKGNHACHGCAFKFGNSMACREAKSCTPKDADGFPVVGHGYLWVAV